MLLYESHRRIFRDFDRFMKKTPEFHQKTRHPSMIVVLLYESNRRIFREFDRFMKKTPGILQKTRHPSMICVLLYESPEGYLGILMDDCVFGL
jgi:hypothetical protein